jgi:peptide-methionine (R)-S-oxide reductase
MDPSRRTLLGMGGAGLLAAIAALLPSRRDEAAATTYPVRLSDAQWRQRLTPGAYAVLRQADTEYPGSSPLNKEHRRGTFVCAGCGNSLYRSQDKFESGTGWPSFTRAIAGHVVTKSDRTMLLSRTEVLCARCGGHLGHVFNDGPKPAGKRYCMNGVAMRFAPA